MPSVTVIGAQWGDEGKGKLVDFLTPGADWVVRYQGGSNAGHTIVVDGVKTTLRLLPSGILRPGSRCVLAAGVVVDPGVLLQEMEKLRTAGVKISADRILVDRNAALVLDYHAAIDQEREKSVSGTKIGTTGRGIGPAYEDRAGRSVVRAAELCDLKALKPRLESVVAEKNLYLKHVLGSQRTVDFVELWKHVQVASDTIVPLLGNASSVLATALGKGEKVVFEGAQGVMLDVLHGTFPYVTSSHTTTGAVLTGCGLGPSAIDHVLGVAKAYTTRVGEGPFPTEMDTTMSEEIRARGHEFGSVTGRPRRCGWFDVIAMKRAVRLCGFTSLAITKLDVLAGLRSVKVCVGYKRDGQILEDLPSLPQEFVGIEPEYVEFAGWDNTVDSVREWEDLPRPAMRYLEALSEMVGCPLSIVSVGVERSATLFTAQAEYLREFMR